MINDEWFNCFQFANFMVSITQTYLISIYDNINIKLEPHFKVFVIDGNLKVTLNIEMDAMWGQLFPLFQINQIIATPHHCNISFWAFFGAKQWLVTTSCNPQQF
jgi:hypothetical protein